MSKKNRKDTDESTRSIAEWISLAISLILLGALAITIVSLRLKSSNRPANFAIKQGMIRKEGSQYHLPVDITNEGDATAAQVKIEGELTAGGKEEKPDITLDFIPAHSTEKIVLVFSEYPSDVRVRVVSYQQP